MRQKFIDPFIQQLKHWLCDGQLGVIMEKNWAHSVNQCQLQALQFLVHLFNLLSILLRYNGFTEIQRVVVDQTDSRPPVIMIFFCESLTLESACRFFWLQSLSWSLPVVT